MTIERGKAWGRSAPLPAHGVLARSDWEVDAAIDAAREEGDAVPTIGLLGGDLCRTLGGRGDEARLRSPEAATLSVDVAEVEIGEQRLVFVAHVIARRSWWRGRIWAAMNAEWLGSWDVAPRAHPGDGLLDVLDVTLGFRDRVKARRRLRTGTHVPHRQIAQSRAATARVAFDKPLDVWVDGRRVARTRSVAVRVTGQVVDVVV